ncbi:MAG TPA: hypothetical protein VLE89_08235 [Chlamydiales bacterium]|nr:hypothetical protein [Chlamydiales bacterium]
MATAEKLNFNTGLQSPHVALQVVSSKVREETPEAAVAHSQQRGSSKPFFPSEPPRLTSSGANPGTGYLAALWAFMTATLTAQIKDATNESQVNTTQNNIASNMVALNQKEADKAQDDLKKYMAALEEQQHQSWWQRLLGVLGAVFGTILAGLTGGACAFLVAAAIMVLMTVPTDKDGTTTFGKLDQALANAGLPSWASALVKVGIVIAATLVGNAVGASAQVGLSMLVNSAKTAAEVAEDAAIDSAASSLPGAAAGDASAAGAAGAGNAGANGANDANSFFAQVRQAGFTRGAVATTLVQMTFAVNPFTDFVVQCAKWHGDDEDKQKLAGAIGGAIFAILAAIACDRIAASGGDASGLLNMKNLLDPKTFKYTYNTIDAIRCGLNISSGTFGILSAKAGLDGAKAERDLGVAQSAQYIYQNDLTMTNNVVQRDQESFRTVNDMFTMTNETWQSYVEPYELAAEILGSSRN